MKKLVLQNALLAAAKFAVKATIGVTPELEDNCAKMLVDFKKWMADVNPDLHEFDASDVRYRKKRQNKQTNKTKI